ncbi:hypothetical protein [Acetobacter persici]|uniref:Uncharacterized protein n=1 Tax=Acetobacter persici TaxID=1076596 RepID=A0A1U9LJY3_9PROT|nr:hypothetical protein [Acetobacter persici]AQT06717.1 hypothetical protein A0U91_17085 [Acetobacter persici]
MTYEEFVNSRKEMTNREFGKLVRDMMWDDEPEQKFLVYGDSFYIEDLGDGRYNLLIGNEETMTNETTSLSDLEAKLYDYAKDECRLEWSLDESPAFGATSSHNP